MLNLQAREAAKWCVHTAYDTAGQGYRKEISPNIHTEILCSFLFSQFWTFSSVH